MTTNIQRYQLKQRKLSGELRTIYKELGKTQNNENLHKDPSDFLGYLCSTILKNLTNMFIKG